MLQRKTSIIVLLYNVPGATYCIGLLSLKNCTDYVYLIDLASVNNFNISRYITPGNILTKCDFLEAVMIIGIHVQPTCKSVVSVLRNYQCCFDILDN